MIKTKAETLSNLQKQLQSCKVPKLYYFSVLDWKKNKKIILKNIKKKFSGKIAIRSSGADEDNLKKSNAGKYLSFLNIDTRNETKVQNYINKVIKSYKNLSSVKSKILIQKMVNSINCSGVVFNRDLNTGVKYYVINYDDVSGKSNTVTSGQTENSNKLLFVYHNNLANVKSEKFSKLLRSVQEVEILLKNVPLDIEFIITHRLEIYILQVRPLVLRKKIYQEQESKINSSLQLLKKNINRRMKNQVTLYGQMPDWNPAEIIGKYSFPLSASLYQKLVLNSSWIKGREIMGYNSSFKDKKLMTIFLSQPFVDLRKSIISFLPSRIKKKLKEKLLNFYLQKLKKTPSLHDKIEFELVVNSFTFDFENQIDRLCPGLLNSRDINYLKKAYKKIFTQNLLDGEEGSLSFNLRKIEKINLNYKILKNEKDIQKLIKFTIDYGIIPFAILARHAFIAENMLRSLSRLNILHKKDINNFKSSTETITSKFIHDCNLLSKKIITYKKFIKKYGHLRPGSYDITSKSYAKLPKKFFINKKNFKLKTEKNKFYIQESTIRKIDRILKKNEINLNTKGFFDYIKKSIEAREYGKFVFTKNLDLILKRITEFATQIGLTKKQVSFLTIEDILKIIKKKYLKKQ